MSEILDILIVGDRPENVQELTRSLQDEALRIHQAVTGEEAMWLLLEQGYALVILDLCAPGADVFEAAALIRRHQTLRHIPLIIILPPGHNDDCTFKGHETGAVDYLVRPIVPRVLRAKVRIFRDLHRELLKEEHLQAWLQTVVAHTSEALMATDETGTIRFMNPAACLMIGISEKDAKGRPVADVFKVTDEKTGLPLSHPVHSVLEHEIPVQRSLGMLAGRSGQKIGVSFNAVPINTDRRHLVGVVLFFRDVSQARHYEKLIEETRRETEQRLQEIVKEHSIILENSLVAILYIRDNIVLHVNKKFEEMFDVVRDEVAGLHADMFLSSSRHYEEFMREADLHLIRKRSYYTERQMKKRDGTVFWCRIVGKAIDSANLKKGVIWLIEDISESRNADAEREKMRLQLLQAQKLEAIGTLAAGVAHDFNNVLTAIQGYIDLALLSLDRDSVTYRNLSLSHKATIRATNLVRQLLLFSRRQPMQFRRIDLKESILGLLKMIGRFLGEDIKITTDIASDLWEIEADAGNIEQVIMNLAVNSRDAMPSGGTLAISATNATIELEECQYHPDSRPGKFVRLRIHDDGTGMDPQTAQHIFEPFFTTKEPGKGTGLGLAVVYGIVKEHKGWISVKTDLGKGTLFEIYFPAAFSRILAEAPENHVSVPGKEGSLERLLLVEDEKDVREFVAKALRGHGYIVTEAVTGLEAMSVFQKESGNFHLVFSDVVLPDILGTVLVTKLCAMKPGLKVLLSSGYEGQKARIQEIREKGIPFLAKPYSLNQLLDTLRGIIAQ